MKKLLTSTLAVILCLLLCACGKDMYVTDMQAAIDPIAAEFGIDMKVVEADGLYKFKSDGFADMPPGEQLDFFEAVDALEKITHADGSEDYIVIEFLDLYSGGKCYTAEFDDVFHRIKADGKEVADKQVGEYVPADFVSGASKCSVCNGTGTAKYYYGESDLEAIADGHESEWYGQCGVCGGTGMTD